MRPIRFALIPLLALAALNGCQSPLPIAPTAAVPLSRAADAPPASQLIGRITQVADRRLEILRSGKRKWVRVPTGAGITTRGPLGGEVTARWQDLRDGVEVNLALANRTAGTPTAERVFLITPEGGNLASADETGFAIETPTSDRSLRYTPDVLIEIRQRDGRYVPGTRQDVVQARSVSFYTSDPWHAYRVIVNQR